MVVVVVGATVVVVVHALHTGHPARLFPETAPHSQVGHVTSTGDSVVVGATVVVVVVAGTQLRLLLPVHTSTGASVVVVGAAVVVVVDGTQLRLLLPEQISTGASVVVVVGAVVVVHTLQTGQELDVRRFVSCNGASPQGHGAQVVGGAVLSGAGVDAGVGGHSKQTGHEPPSAIRLLLTALILRPRTVRGSTLSTVPQRQTGHGVVAGVQLRRLFPAHTSAVVEPNIARATIASSTSFIVFVLNFVRHSLFRFYATRFIHKSRLPVFGKAIDYSYCCSQLGIANTNDLDQKKFGSRAKQYCS